MTVHEFAKLAVSSGLLTSEREATLRADCRPEALPAYIHYLAGLGELTQWQCDKLVTGKYKGFFVEQFKLLRHLDRGPDYSRYVAENTSTGAIATLRCFSGPPPVRFREDPPDAP